MIPRWRVAVAASTLAALGCRLPMGDGRWTRPNFRGRPVHLGAGPAATLGVLAGAAAGAPPRVCVAITAAGALGLYDDLAGGTHARGLRGHARALGHGEVTTGMLKMVGLALAGVAAAPARPGPARFVARLADAALIAGSANLVNLLDLRPGRALKVAALAAAPLTAAGPPSSERVATAVLATAATLMPGDLGERHMIGDCGANALGAALGWVLTERCGGVGRTTALAAVLALTLASERVSFSAVIERHPLLSALDGWGRESSVGSTVG